MFGGREVEGGQVWEQEVAIAEEAGVIPRSEAGVRADEDLGLVKEFLLRKKRPELVDEKKFAQFVKRASKFFVEGGELWRKQQQGRHQRVPLEGRRYELIREAHDDSGTRGNSQC